MYTDMAEALDDCREWIEPYLEMGSELDNVEVDP
jgi:hypothetical protein